MSQPKQLAVMIGSTASDLPEHRDKVMHACLRLGMLPRMMEHLPAVDADAVAESHRLVDEADLYVGIFAFRYGYVPERHEVSVSEMEYERALQRGIPRLIFLMGSEHPVRPGDVETGTGAAKLEALREKLGRERVVSFFNSADELLAHAIHSLAEARKPFDAPSQPASSSRQPEAREASSLRLGSLQIVVAPQDKPPFDVDALAVEDDTYFVLGADSEVREPKEHPIRLWTEVHGTEPAALGSVRLIDGSPLRLHAVVHDLSEDPTVKPDSVSAALTEIMRLVEDRGIRALGLPILGAVHGKLPAEGFVSSLREALRSGPPAALERIWIPCGIDGAKELERLLQAET